MTGSVTVLLLSHRRCLDLRVQMVAALQAAHLGQARPLGVPFRRWRQRQRQRQVNVPPITNAQPMLYLSTLPFYSTCGRLPPALSLSLSLSLCIRHPRVAAGLVNAVQPVTLHPALARPTPTIQPTSSDSSDSSAGDAAADRDRDNGGNGDRGRAPRCVVTDEGGRNTDAAAVLARRYAALDAAMIFSAAGRLVVWLKLIAAHCSTQ